MTRYEVRGIPLSRNATADEVKSYLRGKGYAVDSVSTAWDKRTGYLRVTVESDTDPTADMQAFDPPPEPVDELEAEARAVMDGLAAQQDRTPLETLVLVLAQRVL